jgi:peptide/nickel transport system ATP-binding protein
VTQTKPTLLKVENLSRDFDVSAPWLQRLVERQPRRWLKAVQQVSFEIQAGETLALVGESGCGKSTLARLLAGLYLPTSGRIEFDGINLQQGLASKNASALRKRIQMIFQDPYASLNPRWHVGDIVAEPLGPQLLNLPPDLHADRVGQLLRSVGLDSQDARKFPHQFSGGQRQRISIARALACQPEFLICDEPTSALDVSVQAQVLNLMKDLQQTHHLTYLFISHNLAVVRQVSDRVGVMYLGRLVEMAPTEQLFSAPRHPYTRMLLDSIPQAGAPAGSHNTSAAGEVPNPMKPPSGCSFHPRCALATDLCRQQAPELKTFKSIALACHQVHLPTVT